MCVKNLVVHGVSILGVRGGGGLASILVSTSRTWFDAHVFQSRAQGARLKYLWFNFDRDNLFLRRHFEYVINRYEQRMLGIHSIRQSDAYLSQ